MFILLREIDGKVYVGVVKSKETAKQEYDSAVSSVRKSKYFLYFIITKTGVMNFFRKRKPFVFGSISGSKK